MDIEPPHLILVKDILKHHLPHGSKVWIFGSRATKAKKRFSDLDLAIKGDDTLPLSLLASLQHDFAESDLPYKVDIVDLNTIETTFYQHIKNNMIALPY